jgi:hypothetical protein
MSEAMSLGEVEMLARRAARGAGLSWDLAEEAGRAVRGLSMAGIDGAAALARLLAEIRVRRDLRLAPVRALDRVWRAEGGALCPIRAGASLSDMARLMPPDGVGMEAVLVPVLILPFAADVARRLEGPVTLSWRGGILSLGPEGLPQAEGVDKLMRVQQAGLHLHPGGPGLPAARAQTRARPDLRALAALEALARRTRAPAGEMPG